MKNTGYLLVIVGLVIFLIVGLPDALIKFVGIVLTAFGLFAIIVPHKADAFIETLKIKKCCGKKTEAPAEEPVPVKKEKKAPAPKKEKAEDKEDKTEA